MTKAFRWLLRLVTGISIIALVGAAAIYWLATRSLPDYDAAYRATGPSAPLEIVRDTSAVPHVFGASDADAYFGLGFAHAQDRLWQMMMYRRTAQGRLSELFGERTLATDEMVRRLDLYNLAVSSVAAQDAATQEMLRAYSAGVNAWIAEVNAGARGRGAPEFWVFEPRIAPWQPADSLAVMKLMSLKVMTQLPQEILRARVSLMLTPERVEDILPAAPGTGIAALPRYAALVPGSTRLAAEDGGDHRAEGGGAGEVPTPLPRRGWGGASNVWAAAPSRSAAGGTLMANDPHLGFEAPGIWYLARLELSSGGVIGGTIPGVPVVFLGRSERLAWGVTSSYLDDQDVYVEKLSPDDPEAVLTPEGWAKMRTRTSIVEVAGGEPVTLTLRWTENGPVLPSGPYSVGTVVPPGHVASLAWTALAPGDTTMSGARGVMVAGSVEEGLAAARGIVAPAQNLVLIDGERIGMKLVGAMPRRDPAHQSKGRMPSPGWIAANRWQGVFDYAENPEFIAPEGGIVGNTNNKIVERPFPRHVSYDWGDTQRVQRWRRLMQSREVHTRESFMEAQLDTVSFTARSLLPLIAADLWFTGEPAPEGTPERQRQQALLMLADWNGEMNEHLPEPLIYAAWLRELMSRLTRDELGPVAEEFAHADPVFIERVYRDVDGAGAWCDVIQSAEVEDCAEIARIALDAALLWIGERYGMSLESLRWGDAHQAVHDHAVLGELPVLKWFVNVRQYTSGGDNTLQRGGTRGTGPDPFMSVHGAGYRGVYDFADPDSSVFVLSTGQSGHPLSRHYDDLGDLWRRGEYIPMTLNPELARAGAVGITTIRPR